MRLIVDKVSIRAVDTIPVEQKPGLAGVYRMSEDVANEFMTEFKARSALILDQEKLAKKWNEFCLRKKNVYLGILLGFGPILLRLNRWGWISRFYRKSAMRNLGNMLRCDAHRNVALTILQPRKSASHK